MASALRFSSNFVRNICRQKTMKIAAVNCCVSRNLSTSKFLIPRNQQLLIQSSSYASNTQPGSSTVSLSEFLKREIELEKEVSKKHTVRKIQGFDMKTDGAEVILTKTQDNEKISVKFNVNESAGQDESFNEPPSDKQGEELAPNIVCRPVFQVEIEKNNQRMVFECAFADDNEFDDMPPQEHDPDEVRDRFHIEMVYFSGGEVTEKTYGSMGSVLDGELYEQLMDYLDERGINSTFADELVQFATYYEHSLYVNLLTQIRSFASHK